MNRMLAAASLLALTLVVACGKEAAPPEDKYAEGRRLMESGEFAAAQQYFEGQLAAAPADPEPVFLAGQAAAMGANYAAAEAHFNKALELKPETAEYYAWLGRLYGAQARVADLAVRFRLAPKVKTNFEKALELNPQDVDSKFFLGLYYIAAPANLGGDPNKAKAFADEMMASHPILAQRLLGQFHRARKQPAEAEAAFQAVLALAPDDPQTHSDLGDYYLAEQQPERALEHYRKSLELDPDYQPGLFGIGQVGVVAPEYAEGGIEAVNTLLSLPADITSPNRGQATYGLGALYASQGKTGEAIEAYQKSVDLGYAFALKPLNALKAAAAATAETTATAATVVPEASVELTAAATDGATSSTPQAEPAGAPAMETSH